MSFKHHCNVEDAPKFWEWIQKRGGVAVWHSADLSDPGRSWSAPALESDGTPKAKQHWKMEDKPAKVVTNPDEIEVHEDHEVKRFRVAVQPSSGLSLECTGPSTRKIRKAVADAGTGAYYQFDYETQEAVIFAPSKTYSLTEWARKNNTL